MHGGICDDPLIFFEDFPEICIKVEICVCMYLGGEMYTKFEWRKRIRKWGAKMESHFFYGLRSALLGADRFEPHAQSQSVNAQGANEPSQSASRLLVPLR
jgi:hypothetical protein